ncbi:ATP-binding cassette domain-containing protein [Streptomyces rameus]|uniref:ATP-binding cassette domain-containing protein n=1 Tax=Streptomyces rameus TaxID=68261 RepID=UPI003CD0B312
MQDRGGGRLPVRTAPDPAGPAGRPCRPAGRRRRRVSGCVAQTGGADPRITVREELVTPGRMYRLPGAEAVARAGEPAREPDLTGLPDHRTGALSGARRRRLDIATALTHRPGALFPDEPTTGLDLITHCLDAAHALADRLVIVDRSAAVQGRENTLPARPAAGPGPARRHGVRLPVRAGAGRARDGPARAAGRCAGRPRLRRAAHALAGLGVVRAVSTGTRVFRTAGT